MKKEKKNRIVESYYLKKDVSGNQSGETEDFMNSFPDDGFGSYPIC